MDKNKVAITPIYRATDPLGHLARSPSHSIRNNDHDDQRLFTGTRDGSSFGETGVHSSVISHTESKRRKRGEPVIIQRRIIFEGVVYQIDEELYSDSDHSSVYTSEDDFEYDKNIQRKFKRHNPLVEDKTNTEVNYDEHDSSVEGDVTPKPELTIQRLGTNLDSDGRTTPIDAKTAEILQKTRTDFGGNDKIIAVSQLGETDSDDKVELKTDIGKIKVADATASVTESIAPTEGPGALKVPKKETKKQTK